MNDEKVFAIETNTTDSHFSRRYDPAKYLKYFDKRKLRNLVFWVHARGEGMALLLHFWSGLFLFYFSLVLLFLHLWPVAEAIMEIIPDAVMMKNQIPKSWQHHDMYSNLVPNDDPTQTYFE